MKTKLPIQLSNLYFTDFSLKQSSTSDFNLSELSFDLRHDFLIDKDFIGIAAEIHFDNLNYDDGKGVRRKVTAYLFDATDRLLLLTKQINVNISGCCRQKIFRISFPSSETEYKSGHSYRLHLRDDKTGTYLGEQCFHVFSTDHMGVPEKWYEINCGGLIADGDFRFLRCCDAAINNKQAYKIRFEFSHNIPGISLEIHPEVEMRLYYPASDHVEVNFIEPRYAYRGDFTYFVDIPFHPSTHFKGVYYVELLSMDTPIAGFTFDTDQEVEGVWDFEGIMPVDDYDYATVCRRHNEMLERHISSENEEDEEKLTDDEFEARLNAFIASEMPDPSGNHDNSEDPGNCDISNSASLIAELDGLTGLHSVKEKIRIYDSVMRFAKLRSMKGFEAFPTPLHAMFLGSPGTGKTTVAKLMGEMLKRAGVLSSGHVIVKDRASLIGKYYNSEAEKTIEAIEQAQGGILFIDEAYSLFQPDDPKDPGKFVIEALLTALADPAKDDWMLILAGYPDGMRRLFELNPGLKSRIPESNIYTFDDFSEKQLMEIAEKYLAKIDFSLSPEAREALSNRLAYDYAHRDHNFGNARHVMNLIQTEILPAMAVRVMRGGLEDIVSLSEILPSDIRMPIPTPIPTSRRAPIGFVCRAAV